MSIGKALNKKLCFLFCSIASLAIAQPPFFMLRLRAPETDDERTWEETRAAIAAHPGCCDEVWFSTGIEFPPIDVHRARAAKQRKAAADCRAMGVQPGLQIMATLGHGDHAAGDNAPPLAWGAFTGEGGVACKWCGCPRQKALLDYFEEVGRIYGAWQPSSVWLDDDLRISNHRPATDKTRFPGCWCETCLADFSTREGRTWTRESLRAAMASDAALAARWRSFAFDSIAEVARRIAVGVHAVSPQTRMGYQHAYEKSGLQTKVYRAMADATGLPVRSRPGAGAYYDHDPYEQLSKAYHLARQRATLGEAPYIEQCCPEIESWPRKFSNRTPRGVLLEAFENLALGMDSVSMLITDSRFESMDWYGRTFFKALAANRAMLKGFADLCRGTRPAGLFAGDRNPVRTESTGGIPLVNNNRAVRLGDYAEFVSRNGGKGIAALSASSSELLAWAVLADEATGGRMPVVPLDAVQAWVMPRVKQDGTLVAVAMVNTTIGESAPTRFLLRGVPATCRVATWHALDARPVSCPLVREDGKTVVTVPPLGGWSAGWLGFTDGAEK